MARTVRDRKLDSRSARAQLPGRAAPYWCALTSGRAVGYSKGKGGGSWLARYRAADGVRVQRTLGRADDHLDSGSAAVLTFAAAQELARAWFGQLDNHNGHRTDRYSVDQALNDYLAAFTGKSLGKTKWAVDRYLRPALGQQQVTALTPELLGRFLRDQAARPAVYRANRNGVRKERPTTESSVRTRRATANRILTILKAALNKAFRDGKVPSDDAWRRVRPFAKVDSPRIRYFSPQEAVRLVNAAAPDFRPLIQAALLTGARWSELCKMRVRDVDLVAGVIHIPVTKAGRPRYVHLTDEGIAMMQSECVGKGAGDLLFTNRNGRPFGASHQIRPMREACQNGKVDHAGFHILRHTYGSRLAMAGVPMAVIAQALGHADERITQKHYAHLSPSYVRDAIRAELGSMGVFTPTNVVALKD